MGRRRLQVRATELSRDQATSFFTEVVVPYVGNSVIKPSLLDVLQAGDILADPAGAAALRPVFELS